MAGADVIVAQGSEAGGHRGAFKAEEAEAAMIGLFSLLPQVVDRVEVPVVATGGIADGRGIAAALVLGASAVQIGTALLPAPEAGTNPAWEEWILGFHPEGTRPTRAFSGRLGRAVRTAYVEAAAAADAPDPADPTGSDRSDARRSGAQRRRADLAGLGRSVGRARPDRTRGPDRHPHLGRGRSVVARRRIGLARNRYRICPGDCMIGPLGPFKECAEVEVSMPEVLNPDQIAFYRSHGYLLLERRVPDDIIDAVRSEIERFKAMARGMTDSDARIDLEDSHRPDDPRIRRVKQPNTQSAVIDDLLHSDHILAPVRDLIGPNLRLQTSKLNMKSAGFGAAVEWHQDWAFYPYTNDDVLAVGLIIDDMGAENGPLMVFPGSHRDPIYSHHHNGVFCGAMDLAADGFDMKDAVPLAGPAGSISIHHARIVHGSALNTSTRDRRIIFFEMMAADAFPIVGGRGGFVDWDEFNGRMLCGRPTLEPRIVPCPVRASYPDAPSQGSIYEVQKAMGKRSFSVAE